MTRRINARGRAARSCLAIIDHGKSLDQVLEQEFASEHDDQPLIQEIVYGVCRHYGELNQISTRLLNKPIRRKDRVVHFILLVGLYQLRHLQTAAHAAVSETVAACQQVQKAWAKNMVNGCLRRWQREAEALEIPLPQRAALNHPEWFSDALKQQCPDVAESILQANDERAPMILRVNQARHTRAEYLQELAAVSIAAHEEPNCPTAIRLEKPVPVVQLPGFFEGSLSVQDTAAQLAGHLFEVQPGHKVLDACAAPGGKAAHLQELCANQLHLDALDVAATRVASLRDTFKRLQLSANCYVADATAPPSWALPVGGYDAILIDAPCSGTGVIRRHPDIKHHRRSSDIAALAKIQTKLLDNLWPLLKQGGQLLYLTCSVLQQENEQQIAGFLARHDHVEVLDLKHPSATRLDFGCQTLPGVHQMDGFYYCLLRKI